MRKRHSICCIVILAATICFLNLNSSASAHEKVVVIPLTKGTQAPIKGYAPLTAVSPPNSAYHDSGLNYIIDTVTGLVWQRGQSSTEKTWDEAWEYCQFLALPAVGGWTDWRVPTVEELVSIADYGKREPAINNAFTGTDPGFGGYWSATTLPYEFHILKTRAATVSYRTGSSSHYEKTVALHVRCVRTGTAVAGPNDHYKENGDGTLTDMATGVVWLKDGDCKRFHGLDNSVQNYRPWAAANQSCNWLNTNHCGLTDGSRVGDWRLPNIKELQSIIDHKVNGPTINTTALSVPWEFPRYWAEDIPVGETDVAWMVDFASGYISYDYVDNSYYVRCVRK